jgi:hypothetical protein
VGKTRPQVAGEEYGEQKTGGGIGCASVQRMQAQKLYHQQEPAEYPGEAGIQKVLSF